MFLQSMIEIITNGDRKIPLTWSLAIFLIAFAALFMMKVTKRLNPKAKSSRLLWFVMLAALPSIIISGEQIINYTLASAGAGVARFTENLSEVLLWFAGGQLLVEAINIFIWTGIVRKNTNEPVPKIITNFVTGVIYLFVLYFIMTTVFNLKVTGLVVSSGIIAGVLGLSMQNILSDLIAGIALAIDKPYRIGDWIEFNDGTLGEVIDINWRSTRLLSWKKSVYVIPNGKAMEATLHNFNLPDRRYSTIFYVTISPEVPPETARRILLESALSCDVIIKDPPPSIRLMDIEKRPYRYMVSATYIDYPSHFSGRDQLMMSIWSHFKKTGIESSCETNEVNFSRKKIYSIADPGVTELLSEIPLFRTLSEGEIEKLSAGAQISLFRSGEYIARKGDPGASLLLVTAGVASVSHKAADGSTIELSRFGLGDSLGEASLLTGEPRNSDITAVTDCRIVEIPKDCLEEIIRDRPELLDDLAEVMARRRLEHDSKLNEPLKKSTSELLSTYAIEMINSMKDFFRM